jgi:porphyrinogen peroxidase
LFFVPTAVFLDNVAPDQPAPSSSSAVSPPTPAPVASSPSAPPSKGGSLGIGSLKGENSDE